MAKWGNALGGWKRQARDTRGRFGPVPGAAKKTAVRLAKKSSRSEIRSAKKTIKSDIKASNSKRRSDFKKRATTQQRLNPYSFKGQAKRSATQQEHSRRVAASRKTYIKSRTESLNRVRSAKGKKKLTQKQVRRREAQKAIAMGVGTFVAIQALSAAARQQALFEIRVNANQRAMNLRGGNYRRSAIWLETTRVSPTWMNPAGAVLKGSGHLYKTAKRRNSSPPSILQISSKASRPAQKKFKTTAKKPKGSIRTPRSHGGVINTSPADWSFGPGGSHR